MMATDLDSGTLKTLAAIFAVNSVAGLTALLNSGQKITWVRAVSAMLYSGLIGAAIYAILSSYMKDELLVAMGVSVLAGLGGASLLDLIKAGFQQGGINFHVDLGPAKKKDHTDEAA